MKNKAIANLGYKYVEQRFKEQQQLEKGKDAGGALRTFSGWTVENLIQLLWSEVSKNHPDVDAKVAKGDDVPMTITDDEGNSIEESVDQHCFVNGKCVLAIECKTYLDKCYMQRADSDFAIMRESGQKFSGVIVSLENSIKDSSYQFFIRRKNIDKVFYLADGKRNSVNYPDTEVSGLPASSRIAFRLAEASALVLHPLHRRYPTSHRCILPVRSSFFV